MRHLLFLAILCTTLAACATRAPLPAVGSFALEPGQRLDLAPDLTLRFDAVEDSRCPPGVLCVWAGRLGYRFSLHARRGAPESFELSPTHPTAAPALLGGRRILLDENTIPPPPVPGATAHYRAGITIAPPDSSPTQPRS